MEVYTTRCDTLFGATYMVMSPEHALVKKWLEAGLIANADEVRAYQDAASRKSDFERTEMAKDKTGVKLEGLAGVNPVNDAEIPIYISDYVLASYGTGAIMAVPAHDERDFDFAEGSACRSSRWSPRGSGETSAKGGVPIPTTAYRHPMAELATSTSITASPSTTPRRR